MNLAVPHRGHRGEGHVKGVERRKPVDQRKPHGSDQQRGSDGQDDQEKTAGEPIHRVVSTKYNGNAARLRQALPISVRHPGDAAEWRSVKLFEAAIVTPAAKRAGSSVGRGCDF